MQSGDRTYFFSNQMTAIKISAIFFSNLICLIQLPAGPRPRQHAAQATNSCSRLVTYLKHRFLTRILVDKRSVNVAAITMGTLGT